MTQAYNLAILANAVDTSGRLNVGTNATGTLPLANGGTGTTNTVNSIVAGTGITTSVSGTAVTINASGSGTVTSVATGNGLSGGTITTSGTLTVACPTWNSVGSYAFAYGVFGTYTAGSNYSAGDGGGQVRACFLDGADGGSPITNTGNTLSGTWKYMALSTPANSRPNALFCRVS